MASPHFTDERRRPTGKDVLLALGPAARSWTELFERLRAEHPDLDEVWRFYGDAKSWLLKVTRRSKTVCWVSVEQGTFRVAFYFPERLSAALLASDLSETRKAAIRKGAPSGKLRAVPVVFGPRRGVRDVLTLVALKKTLSSSRTR